MRIFLVRVKIWSVAIYIIMKIFSVLSVHSKLILIMLVAGYLWRRGESGAGHARAIITNVDKIST